MLDIYEIKKIADNKLKEFKDKGFATQGNNGPYLEKDTPVRNTAHWLQVYSDLWIIFKETEYLEMVKMFSKYLLVENYGDSGAIKCFYENKNDCINGLIGQAWAIEGLIKAANILQEEKYYMKAKDIFLTQLFDWDKGLWSIIDIDGTNFGFDIAYNHQLFFAVAGALILKVKYDEEIDNRITCFLDKQNNYLRAHKNGLIVHFIKPQNGLKELIKFYLRIFLSNISHICGIKQLNNRYYYENGYHMFSLYGFALLYDIKGKHSFFNSKKFKKILNYGLSEAYFAELLNPNPKDCMNKKILHNSKFNEYAFLYNSPAFEYPLNYKKIQ